MGIAAASGIVFSRLGGIDGGGLAVGVAAHPAAVWELRSCADWDRCRNLAVANAIRRFVPLKCNAGRLMMFWWDRRSFYVACQRSPKAAGSKNPPLTPGCRPGLRRLLPYSRVCGAP